RGITSIGYLFALCRLQIDSVRKILKLRKVAPYPCQVPLIPLADWEKGIVPKVSYSFVDGEIKASIEGAEILSDWQLVWT
ncbi:MAG: hypothetical protein NZ937_08535, partial [Armatimonadetes bacterium]|nr:hypothetical protein [Armatimonadota bacterium]